jgi:hypothetical protein
VNAAAHYDPELPFLADLEEQVRAHAERAIRPPRRSRRPHPVALRMTRRTAVLVGLLCLLAATAFGARAVFSGGSPSPAAVHQGAFVLVEDGQTGEDRWTLRLYTRGGELCRALVVLDQTASSRCAPAPAPETVGVMSAASARRRYVFGVAGARVDAIRVRAGASQLTVATHALSERQARAAGASSATRYFLAILTRPLGRPDPPAIVTGLDAAHRRLGGAHVDCLEDSSPPSPPPCGPRDSGA